MRFVKLLFFMASFGAIGVALAADKAAITNSLQLLIPGRTPDTITETGIDGLYEVTYGPRIYYVSENGRFVIQGNLLDLNRMANLTAEHQASLTKAALNKIGEENMIVFPAKKEKHRIWVFTDIDCGYCKKLHSQIDEYNAKGISIRYLFFPRTGPDTPSYYKARDVWCADDRQQALTDSKKGKKIESRNCDNPVDEHLQLVRDLGLNGTPTIVLEDGQVVPGYVPPDKLAAMLDENAAKR